MPRGIFISYQRQDKWRAAGFNLMAYNRFVDANFRGRHLLTPVNSRNPSYIRKCVRDQMKGTSVTVVLLGEKTHQSNWVAWEIKETLARGKGVVAIRLKDQPTPLPDNSEVAQLLRQSGAEILDWDPQSVTGAIERAARMAGRVRAITNRINSGGLSGGATAGGGSQQCNR
jgi:hypothetical protein